MTGQVLTGINSNGIYRASLQKSHQIDATCLIEFVRFK